MLSLQMCCVDTVERNDCFASLKFVRIDKNIVRTLAVQYEGLTVCSFCCMVARWLAVLPHIMRVWYPAGAEPFYVKFACLQKTCILGQFPVSALKQGTGSKSGVRPGRCAVAAHCSSGMCFCQPADMICLQTPTSPTSRSIAPVWTTTKNSTTAVIRKHISVDQLGAKRLT